MAALYGGPLGQVAALYRGLVTQVAALYSGLVTQVAALYSGLIRQVAALYSGLVGQVVGLIKQVPLYWITTYQLPHTHTGVSSKGIINQCSIAIIAPVMDTMHTAARFLYSTFQLPS